LHVRSLLLCTNWFSTSMKHTLLSVESACIHAHERACTKNLMHVCLRIGKCKIRKTHREQHLPERDIRRCRCFDANWHFWASLVLDLLTPVQCSMETPQPSFFLSNRWKLNIHFSGTHTFGNLLYRCFCQGLTSDHPTQKTYVLLTPGITARLLPLPCQSPVDLLWVLYPLSVVGRYIPLRWVHHRSLAD